jgi:hypothetical protein
MQGSTFANINLGNASFIDLTGMTINGVLVSELIRAYEKHSQ